MTWCEEHDFCIFNADRGIQYVLGPLPKLVELSQDVEAIENQYLPNGTEG